MAFLIIDGHGKTDTSINFDFRRPSDTRISVFSYTRKGLDIGVPTGKRIVQAAIAGTVKDGWTQRTDSRIGGISVMDRILAAKELVGTPPQEEWVTPIKENSSHVRLSIGPDNVPLECYFTGGSAALDAAIVVATITPGDTRTLPLSEIFDTFNTQTYSVIWAPCRGF